MNQGLEKLLQEGQIWRGKTPFPDAGAALSTGFAALDTQLPGRGWPKAALTEILLPNEGVGELRLVMPALAQLSHQGRWLAWIAPPYIPYAPALSAWNINLSRVLLVHPRANHDGFWAIEQALRSGTCGAVLAWPKGGDQRIQRRLQLAAEAGQCCGFLFRHERTATRTSCAALRLKLTPSRQGAMQVQILKRRGASQGADVQLDLDSEVSLTQCH